MNTLSPIKQEFLRRQEIRGSFLAWCRHCGYEPAAHHKIIISELEMLVENLFRALLRGCEAPSELLRLMVMTPPGSAKSTYISKLFPPWFLAQATRFRNEMEKLEKRYDNLGVLATTHNGDLSIEFGGAARNIVIANEKELGYTLNKDSRASDAWTCTNGGYYRAGTVGSGISGRRMHLGIVDDFCGKEEDATSKLINDKIWVWWENDFVNRLQPISARLIIANHRNEDDLCGRLLAKEAAKWRVIRLRLIIENEEQAEQDPLHRKVGERLWPEYFTDEQVKERMANPRSSGIQQQEPSPEKGSLFQSEWFAPEFRYNSLDVIEGAPLYGASDHAVSEAQTADNSCLGMGAFKDGLLYIHPDLVWDRIGSKRAVEELLRMGQKTIWWRAEKGHISKSILPFLQDRMSETGKYFSIIQVTPTKDKVTRSQSFLGLCASGRVRWPSNALAPWMGRAVKEMLVFPNGRKDDFVDFCSHLGMGVANMFSKTPVKKEVEFDTNQSGFNITSRSIREQGKRDKRQLAFLDR